MGQMQGGVGSPVNRLSRSAVGGRKYAMHFRWLVVICWDERLGGLCTEVGFGFELGGS